tara:strand:+ start:1814 stop:2062 length:249 start_codon:yes stop_codon:yes gene_type:complete
MYFFTTSLKGSRLELEDASKIIFSSEWRKPFEEDKNLKKNSVLRDSKWWSYENTMKARKSFNNLLCRSSKYISIELQEFIRY